MITKLIAYLSAFSGMDWFAAMPVIILIIAACVYLYMILTVFSALIIGEMVDPLRDLCSHAGAIFIIWFVLGILHFNGVLL